MSLKNTQVTLIAEKELFAQEERKSYIGVNAEEILFEMKGLDTYVYLFNSLEEAATDILEYMITLKKEAAPNHWPVLTITAKFC
jgi:hypothetical protein